MTILPIITYQNDILRNILEPVDIVTDEIRTFMDDMLETMYQAPGVGLAACQVGDNRRIIVLDAVRDAADDEKRPMYFVNPEIYWTSDETSEYEEGCLSIPGVYENVTRPAECKLTYLDYDGAPQDLHCKGFLATVIQHEIDHLNGVLFIDHISRLKRSRAIKKYKKAQNDEKSTKSGTKPN